MQPKWAPPAALSTGLVTSGEALVSTRGRSEAVALRCSTSHSSARGARAGRERLAALAAGGLLAGALAPRDLQVDHQRVDVRGAHAADARRLAQVRGLHLHGPKWRGSFQNCMMPLAV